MAACSSGVLIRVPDSKSMPKLMPSTAIARAPAAMITPEAEKKYRDMPVKSKRQRPPSPPAPSAQRERRSRVRAIEPRIAEVASTAVKRDTIVPIPRVKAKPLTPAVASVKRMNATPIVTTLASTIVRSALP